MYDLSKIKEYEPVSKENILRLVSEEEIFRHFLGYDFKIGKTYKSPLREDNNPSFNVYYNPYGELRFKDFNGYQGSCFDLIMAVYHTDFVGACHMINKEMNLSLGDTVNSVAKIEYPEFKKTLSMDKRKTDKLIQFKPRRWSVSDVNYWLQFGITIDILEYYNVMAARFVFLDKQLVMVHSMNNPIYCYKLDKKVKVYRPYSSKSGFKWMSNANNDYIQGWQQAMEEGNDTLIITKSLKDVMCLRSLGYWAIAPHSESSRISELHVKNIHSKFNSVYILYDNDEAGINGAKSMASAVSCNSVIIPVDSNCKDISEFRVRYGEEETIKLLNKIIK
jgi:hypothetical protein